MAEEQSSFYDSCDIEKWRVTLDSYDKILSAKASRDKKGKPNQLLKLDKWYQEDLPLIIGERQEAFINQSELTKLMQWKLSRGKFRPRLTELVQTNGDSAVIETSKKAFKCLPDVKAAVEVMSKLKAVGPATASDPGGEWTEHKVELALWCHVTATRIDPSLVQASSKRKLKEISEDSDTYTACEVNGKKKVKSKN